jgi:peptidoglycan/LPS O-acetylase OafA/YrhL
VKTLKPLTSFRFFFALMVFSCHLHFVKNGDSPALLWLYHVVLKEGYIGVSFFFILSGFIITYTYKDKFLNNTITFKNFIIARIARLYPLHFLTLLIAIPLTFKELFINNQEWIKKLFANIFLIQSFFNDTGYFHSFNGLSWSISDEMFFYIMFPFLILIIFRKNISFISNSLIIIVLFLIVIYLMDIPHPADYHRVFFIFPITRLADFCVGIILCKIYLSVDLSNSRLNFSWLEGSVLITFFLFLACRNFIELKYRYSVYYWLPMGLMIFVFAYQKGGISKILSKQFFVTLGEISFGFYLYHLLVYNYFCALNSRFLHMQSSIGITIVCLIATLIISYLSYFYYEKPLNQWLKKKMLR